MYLTTMNKKVYITPALFTMTITQCLPIAASTEVGFDSSKTITDNSDIGTKEYQDWNIWE